MIVTEKHYEPDWDDETHRVFYASGIQGAGHPPWRAPSIPEIGEQRRTDSPLRVEEIRTMLLTRDVAQIEVFYRA
jgi:hypothetical protein